MSEHVLKATLVNFVAALCLCAAPAMAAPGDLDTTLGPDGSAFFGHATISDSQRAIGLRAVPGDPAAGRRIQLSSTGRESEGLTVFTTFKDDLTIDTSVGVQGRVALSGFNCAPGLVSDLPEAPAGSPPFAGLTVCNGGRRPTYFTQATNQQPFSTAVLWDAVQVPNGDVFFTGQTVAPHPTPEALAIVKFKRVAGGWARDETFGGPPGQNGFETGLRAYDFKGAVATERGKAITVSPDGTRLAIAGTLIGASQSVFVAYLDAATGNPVAAFDTDGYLDVPIASSTDEDAVRVVVKDPGADGGADVRVIAVANATSDDGGGAAVPQVAMASVNASTGALDGTFGAGGIKFRRGSGTAGLVALDAKLDGNRLVVAGRHTDAGIPRPFVAAVDSANGNPQIYGTGGLLVPPTSAVPAGVMQFDAIAVNSVGGTQYFAGSTAPPDASASLTKLNFDGSGGATVIPDHGPILSSSRVQTSTPLEDGGILALTNTPVNGRVRPMVQRRDQAGATIGEDSDVGLAAEGATRVDLVRSKTQTLLFRRDGILDNNYSVTRLAEDGTPGIIAALPAIKDTYVDGFVPLSDGSVVIHTDEPAVARVRPDGAPDLNFGGDGKVELPNGADKVVPGLGGRFYVVTASAANKTTTIQAFQASGLPDGGFGLNSKAVQPVPFQGAVDDAWPQPGGGVLVHVVNADADAFVAVDASGGLDPAVNGGAVSTVDVPPNATGPAAWLPDGRIYRMYGNPPDRMLERRERDGSLDTSFGNGGSVNVSAFMSGQQTFAVDARGRFVFVRDLAYLPGVLRAGWTRLEGDRADLSVIAAAPASAPAGQLVTGTFTVRNDGPQAARFAAVKMNGGGLGGATATKSTGGTCALDGGDCSLGKLAVGEEVKITVSGTQPAAGATLTAEASSLVFDPDAADASATASIALPAPPAGPAGPGGPGGTGGGQGTPIDRTPPVLTIAAGRLGLRALLRRTGSYRVTVSSNEAARGTVVLLLTPRKTRKVRRPKPVVIATKAVILRAGQRLAIKLKLSKRGKARLRSAGRTPKLTLRFVASDAAGNSATKTRTVKVRR